MERILTGIQSTGVPHLGNLLGAILPAIKKSHENTNAFLFIADLHSLTQIKDAEILKKNSLSTASAWLAFGLNPNNVCFYRQSDVPQVTELAWYLSCFFPFSRLSLAHSFKDKSSRFIDVNAGLFSYPMLMAADILLYDADVIPVGKDQLQHIEIARDVASRVHTKYGEVFKLPRAFLNSQTNYILGTDGTKMSKSNNNIIDIFCDENDLYKQIMSISTSSTPLNEPKNPEDCTVFHLYSLISNKNEINDLKNHYLSGGYGYGDAKKLLFNKILVKFESERRKYNEFNQNPDKVESILLKGAKKASQVGDEVLNRFRKKLGFN